jgi:BirA family biotin operon repressor/biotin-[acetyl-CoA-carboxylase] ligase
VKWPNDIWVERRKCAGILVESRTVGSLIDSVIIGVGLNVNRMQWPEELEGIATSLRAEAPGEETINRAEVLAAVLFHMERWVSRLARSGAAVVVDALRPNLALLGERIRFEDDQGVFEGIQQDGAALVRTAGGLRTLHAAHIEPLER